MNGLLLGRLLVSVINQGSGAPFADQCFSTCEAAPGVSFGGYAFLLAPWRRNRYGDRRAGKALAVTWQGFRPRQPLPRPGPSVEMCAEMKGEAPQ